MSEHLPQGSEHQHDTGRTDPMDASPVHKVLSTDEIEESTRFAEGASAAADHTIDRHDVRDDAARALRGEISFDEAVQLAGSRAKRSDSVAAASLSGDEKFDGVEASVLDFWRFAVGDLRMNSVRGMLAEFLVARAVGSRAPRVEWDAFDVLAPDGTRIEVKASGFLQSWHQERLSAVSFQVRPTLGWDARTNTSSVERTYQADVYVFAHQTATQPDTYDALSVAQWDFYVLSRSTVESFGGSRVGLERVRQVTDAVSYAELAGAIAATRP